MEAVNVLFTIEGNVRKISKLQATAMQLATKAATGDTRAIVKLLDWVDDFFFFFFFFFADIEVIKAVYARLVSKGSQMSRAWTGSRRNQQPKQ